MSQLGLAGMIKQVEADEPNEKRKKAWSNLLVSGSDDEEECPAAEQEALKH